MAKYCVIFSRVAYPKESVVDQDIGRLNTQTLQVLTTFIVSGIVEGLRIGLQAAVASEIANSLRKRAFANIVEQEMGRLRLWSYCKDSSIP